MGKIVKFCSSCDEGFAEKFGYCPNCGKALQAFEMNPLVSEAPRVEPAVVAAPAVVEAVVEPTVIAAPVPAEMSHDVSTEVFEDQIEEEVIETAPVSEIETAPVDEIETAPAEVEYEEIETAPAEVEYDEIEATPAEVEYEEVETAPAEIEYEEVDDTFDIEDEEPVVYETPAPRTVPVAAPVYARVEPLYADTKPTSLEAEHDAYVSEGGFYVTVIEEKNVGQRNMLMLGTLGFMVFALIFGVVISIFSKDLEVGSINDDIFNAVLMDDVPAIVPEEEKQKADEKDAGGGGGGGRDEKEETTQGDLADQSPNPTRPPDAKVHRSDNFELVTPPPQTEGNRTFEKKFDRWGDPNGRFASFSNGTGTGGGQGSGTGTGQGSGRGTGAGSGDGSGSGGGLGSGNGDGSGAGNGGAPPPPPAGVTTALRIISKPRPGYTDSARQNNVQGTVILRVTFLGSGQIGSISAVKGLPNGLTEQAIAAARRISFEPKKIGGIGQAVTRQIEYTFSIY